MACVKSVNRSASVALAPDGVYMAAGTMAGAVDLSFSSSASLEILKLDFQADDLNVPVVAEHPSAERFNRLSWGKNGSGSDAFGLGLIAGGLVDGNIDIYNPHYMINGEDGDGALVGDLSRHKGPVRGLEFNSITPNLLASGADEGEICIWDMAKPAEPTHFPPLKGSGSAAQGEISYLSWNSKVQHILASTSYNGTTVVWDLKKQKPVISFSDSNRRRCSVLQWNPDLATQLIVASDEDNSPALRLWDMRNIMSPVKELVGHTKGVIGMAWCPIDSSYLLTCAKDNRTICWDTVTGEIVCELPSGNNWNFDVHWYSKIPGIISASSFDGNIGLYNIEACDRYGVENSASGSARLRAPKWYKRPSGVSFGFGGKLVSFHPKSPAGGASEIYVHSLVTEESLVARSSDFEGSIQNGEKSALRILCDKKCQESESDDERETWKFLKVMFEEDGTARTKLLTHLGFNLPREDDVQDDISEGVNSLQPKETAVNQSVYEDTKDQNVFSTDNGEDFFNNLSSPKAETPVSSSGEKFVTGVSVPDVKQTEDEEPEEADSSFDDAVQHALVVGDYKGAVAQCLSANKMADALIIAHVGGTALWESTRDQYLKMSRAPYLKVVAAMVNNDLMSLVNTRPLKFWKETLALLCTFSPKEEWTVLCDSLASRLMAAGNTLAATLCFMCAGNIDNTVEIWSRSLSSDHEGKSYVDLLQDLMEKTIVLVLATGQKQFSSSLYKLVEKYAEILASQGLLSTAMEYLKLLGSDGLSPELAILRDRIAISSDNEKEQATDYYYSQQQIESTYSERQPDFSAADVSQPYYQITPSPQLQPVSPYNNNIQQSYVPNPSYQAKPQPSMFVPPVAPVQQENFAPPPVTTQPTVKPFVPAAPPVLLKNAGQYQQPTLASQLYSVNANNSYQPVPHRSSLGGLVPSQAGPAPDPRMQQVAPTPEPRVPQKPNIGPMQPPSPTRPPAVQAPVTAPGPPPTIHTVDTSNVPAHQKPVITTLTRLYNETSEALGGSRANPAKKREIEDNSKKFGALFAKLNSGDISKNAAEKLVQLCQALDNKDFSTALQIQVLLTTSEWDECKIWLAALKRVIKTRQNVRL